MIAFAALFQLTEDMSKYTDKILVREYIKQCIGDQHLSEILQVTDDPDSLNFEAARGNYIKTNHSSGHVWPISQNTSASLLLPQIEAALNQTYGMGKGERLYQYIAPKVFIEQTIEPRRGPTIRRIQIRVSLRPIALDVCGIIQDGSKANVALPLTMNKSHFTLALMTAARCVIRRTETWITSSIRNRYQK